MRAISIYPNEFFHWIFLMTKFQSNQFVWIKFSAWRMSWIGILPYEFWDDQIGRKRIRRKTAFRLCDAFLPPEKWIFLHFKFVKHPHISLGTRKKTFVPAFVLFILCSVFYWIGVEGETDDYQHLIYTYICHFQANWHAIVCHSRGLEY